MLQDPAAIAHLQEAQRLTDDPRRGAEIAGDLVELLVFAGQWDAAVAVIDAARTQVAAGDPLELRLDMTLTAAGRTLHLRRGANRVAVPLPKRPTTGVLRIPLKLGDTRSELLVTRT
ncbi:hypothetical protein [Solirubrobacter soli]|uniref:hypothetical protein n=1 Tax=Solirubrobacter soli TaxID=363832 RepID=UPI00048A36BD|nr:hypothetical protein [Solirubrobacter soli]